MINIFRWIAIGLKPIVGADEMPQPADAFVERVVMGIMHKGVEATETALCLQVKELIVKHVAVLEVFIRPIARRSYLAHLAPEALRAQMFGL